MHEHSMLVLLQHTLKKKSHNLERKKLSALNMEQSQNYFGKKLKRIDIFDINAVWILTGFGQNSWDFRIW